MHLALTRVVIVYLVEQLLVKVVPFLKGILLAEHPWAHVLGNEGSLDEQRSAAAHGVDEIDVTLPSRLHNHSGCEHLVERCLYTFLAIAAAVQRLSAGVERQGALVFCHVHVQPYVGVGHRDVRPLAGALAKLVHDGVFHLVAHKLRVAEFLAEHHRIYGKRLLVVQILAPVNLHHFIVHLVGAISREVSDRFKYLDSGVQLEIGAVHQFLVAGERHHASSCLHVVST